MVAGSGGVDGDVPDMGEVGMKSILYLISTVMWMSIGLWLFSGGHPILAGLPLTMTMVCFDLARDAR